MLKILGRIKSQCRKSLLFLKHIKLKHMNQLNRIYTFLLFLPVFFACSIETQTIPQKPNVLFICVDDLRTELNCYGVTHIKSPHLDQLASEGFLFNKHFVNVPTCGASRHCLLTGQYPVSLAHTKNDITATTTSVLPEAAQPESFIHQLKKNGYYTVGIGKITHHPDGHVYGYLDEPVDKPELPYSWDEMLLNDTKWGSGHHAFFGYANGSNRNTLNKEVKPYECADVSDEAYPDGLSANLAIQKLQELKKKGNPFFLGVGFFKPHLPFTAPKKYWDLYATEDIPLPPYQAIPENSGKATLHGSGEFNQYKLGEEKASLNGPMSDEYVRKMRHAYAACVSYVDAQIGKVLKELDRLGMAENTIVVVWGDHGWHLGDHLVWGKHSIYDRSLHSALLMRVPGMKGRTVEKVVSTTDIYPTLMELCNTPVQHELSGQSMVALLHNANDKEWRNTAYAYWRSGYSMRTPEYRIMRYHKKDCNEYELFDHMKDPNETRNIAGENPELIQELLPELELGNTIKEFKQ